MKDFIRYKYDYILYYLVIESMFALDNTIFKYKEN